MSCYNSDQDQSVWFCCHNALRILQTVGPIPRSNSLRIELSVSHVSSCIVTTNPSRTGLKPLNVNHFASEKLLNYRFIYLCFFFAACKMFTQKCWYVVTNSNTRKFLFLWDLFISTLIICDDDWDKTICHEICNILRPNHWSQVIVKHFPLRTQNTFVL